MEIRRRVLDGFKHEKLITLPNHFIEEMKDDPITKGIHPIYVGYFPEAKYHYVLRADGMPHQILIYCVSGKGSVTVDERTVNLTKGQLFIIPKDHPHHYEADLIEPWSIYWVHFSGSDAMDFMDTLDCCLKPATIPEANAPALIQYFNEIIEMLALGYSKDHLYHASSLLRLLMTCANHTSLNHESVSRTDRNYVQTTIQFMQEHLYEKKTLTDLADYTGISRNHLMVQFKERTGSSPMDYFIHMKIQKSCEALSMTDKPVKAIAADFGYTDPYYFSRLFKQVMGMSPRAYRQNIIH